MPCSLEACAKRDVQNDEMRETFDFYWTKLLPCVAGKDHFGPNIRYYSTISAATLRGRDPTETAKQVITPGQEAACVDLYENNWAKWIHMRQWELANPNKKLSKLEKEEKKNTKFPAKYCEQDGGQKENHGWKQEGIDRFNDLHEEYKQHRADKDNHETIMEVEKEALERVREKKGLQSVSADEERKRKRRKKKHGDQEAETSSPTGSETSSAPTATFNDDDLADM